MKSSKKIRRGQVEGLEELYYGASLRKEITLSSAELLEAVLLNEDLILIEGLVGECIIIEEAVIIGDVGVVMNNFTGEIKLDDEVFMAFKFHIGGGEMWSLTESQVQLRFVNGGDVALRLYTPAKDVQAWQDDVRIVIYYRIEQFK